MSDYLVDKTSALLGKVLDGASSRQRILAQNIANAETPGYTRQDLSFEDELRTAITLPNSDPDAQIAAIERVSTMATTDTTTPSRSDGNNVQAEQEMTELAKNSLEYETAAQLLMMKLRGLRSAIFEGRR